MLGAGAVFGSSNAVPTNAVKNRAQFQEQVGSVYAQLNKYASDSDSCDENEAMNDCDVLGEEVRELSMPQAQMASASSMFMAPSQAPQQMNNKRGLPAKSMATKSKAKAPKRQDDGLSSALYQMSH